MGKIKSTRSFKVSLRNKNLPLIEKWITKEFGEPGTQRGKQWFHKTINKMSLNVTYVNNQTITKRVYTPCKIFYFRDPSHATMFYLKWSNEKME